MKRALAYTAASGALALSAIAGAPAAPTAAPLEVRGGIVHLVAPGDRVAAEYEIHSGSNAVRGTLYVWNDRRRAFAHFPLTRSNGYRAAIPARLLRGGRLLYHAVFHDPRSRRSRTLTGASWLLSRPIVIRLGDHQFGQTRTADAVVARAPADEVGWDINEEEGFHLGPQTFQVGSDGAVWLEDSFNNRLLVWNPGQPDARAVPVPWGAGISDFAFGPHGTVYVTRKLTDPARLVLDRLDGTTGQLLRESRIGLEYAGGPTGDSYPIIGSDSPLRVGPDRTLYYAVMMGLPGGEWGWMPVAKPGGRPLPPHAQLRGIWWPLQPVAGGMRLVGPEFYTAPGSEAPHEARYALVDARGRLVRSWRITSRTELNFIHSIVPEVVGGEPVVVLDFAQDNGGRQQWEYEILRLGPHGTTARFSLSRDVWGDSALDDLRVGPDGELYQLATSPQTGIAITRFSLG